jgi:hypothetical protein
VIRGSLIRLISYTYKIDYIFVIQGKAYGQILADIELANMPLLSTLRNVVLRNRVVGTIFPSIFRVLLLLHRQRLHVYTLKVCRELNCFCRCRKNFGRQRIF